MIKQIEYKTCANCKKKFKVADRASPMATEGSISQIKYCSVTCKRMAGNARYYQRHKTSKKKTT